MNTYSCILCGDKDESNVYGSDHTGAVHRCFHLSCLFRAWKAGNTESWVVASIAAYKLQDKASCTICGDAIDKGETCVMCEFWQDIINHIKSQDRRFFVTKGNAYTIGEEDERGKSDWRGYGGSLFYIKLHHYAGMWVKTTNLWHRGRVPARWRESLPDDAEFRSRESGESIQEYWTYTSIGWQAMYKEVVL